MTLDQFKDAALKTAKVLGHILLTIFKYALTIIAALGSIVFDIFKFFFKEKEWSRDDEDFINILKTDGCLSIIMISTNTIRKVPFSLVKNSKKKPINRSSRSASKDGMYFSPMLPQPERMEK